MRIVIAEDSVLLRAGLHHVLVDAGHEVVAAVDTAEDLIQAVEKHTPELAIIDVRMPPTFTDEGIRAAVLIRAQHPDVAVLVLSQYVEERYAGELIAHTPGGLGYLLKDRVADVTEFVTAVAEVGAGHTVLDPEVVSQLVVRSRGRSEMDALTAREKQVLRHMAEGNSNSAVARELHLSEGSIEKHISAIFTKLGLPHEQSLNRRVVAVLRYLGSRSDLA